MKILDNSDKHLLPILPEIVSKELGKNADKFNNSISLLLLIFGVAIVFNFKVMV